MQRIRSALNLAWLWFERAYARARLQKLDRRDLRDTGANATEWHRECSKWFWRR
jgi:uncharacterized protein YjiS (DUF1127 family)